LGDAIRDMLDFAGGWCNPSLTEKQRLGQIERIGSAALCSEEAETNG
jgi:hypothetical protein